MLLEKGLYTIEEFSFEENKVKSKLSINAKDDAFNGHFPNKSILPGVCMVQIIKELTEKAVAKRLSIDTGNRIKFVDIIDPDEENEVWVDVLLEDNHESIKATSAIIRSDKVCFKSILTFSVK